MPPKKQGKTSTEKSKPFPQEQKPKYYLTLFTSFKILQDTNQTLKIIRLRRQKKRSSTLT